VSNSFKLRPTRLVQGGQNFSRGASPPGYRPALQCCVAKVKHKLTLASFQAMSLFCEWQCLFRLMRKKHCWSYFAFSWTRLVEVFTNPYVPSGIILGTWQLQPIVFDERQSNPSSAFALTLSVPQKPQILQSFAIL